MIVIVGRVSVIVRDYQSDRVPGHVSANRAIVLASGSASDVAMQSGSVIDDRGCVSEIGTHRHRES